MAKFQSVAGLLSHGMPILGKALIVLPSLHHIATKQVVRLRSKSGLQRSILDDGLHFKKVSFGLEVRLINERHILYQLATSYSFISHHTVNSSRISLAFFINYLALYY
ncbi:uncharacterized protein LOC132616800 isoform X2 [Lycium barbarum]|uniref:uncharacterized protein LOC132616800 isoform X2 n=1 Tax=Lycium barbarum TaxID=112863 RepID=UPI00293F6417|nr:uncharacterized protein LOC132616800 isoform X2 [Lycium barbarum]